MLKDNALKKNPSVELEIKHSSLTAITNGYHTYFEVRGNVASIILTVYSLSMYIIQLSMLPSFFNISLLLSFPLLSIFLPTFNPIFLHNTHIMHMYFIPLLTQALHSKDVQAYEVPALNLTLDVTGSSAAHIAALKGREELFKVCVPPSV